MTTMNAARPVVYVDIETTGLHPLRREAYEIAIIREELDGSTRETTIWIANPDLSEATDVALRVGRFYDRHPQFADPAGFDHPLDTGDSGLLTEQDAARVVHRWTRGDATFVGIVPSFDALTLELLLRRNGLAPAWHYALEDATTQAKGWLRGWAAALGEPAPNPRTSEEISQACDVAVPIESERHTAMGDARWAMRLYRATGHRPGAGLTAATPGGDTAAGNGTR